MKKRIISMMAGLAVLCGVFSVSATDVQASESELKKVDESYLTLDEYSEGHSTNDLSRGIHLMDGECSISKAGRDEIYCYGATTANHVVDKAVVIVYVDRYHEATDDEEAYWGQIDGWAEESYNDYFVATGKSIVVDRGYYYRVHADHFVVQGDEIEETFSFTYVIYLPK